MPSVHSMAEHYHKHLRDTDILPQLNSHYPEGAKDHQLAPLDQLHIGGISASARLLSLLDPSQNHHLLDIGSGLGGLMRQGAALGFNIVGLDVTHRFNKLNQALCHFVSATNTAQPGLVTGNAESLPFAEHCFDAIIFQHSLMNMPDADQVLSECRRVLRPGGKVVMHEVVRGKHIDNLRFPVPWSSSAEHSHLLSHHELTELLCTAGFQLLHFEDWTHVALEWRQRQQKKEQGQVTNVISPRWVFGDRFTEMSKNLVENLANEAINVVEISACC